VFSWYRRSRRLNAAESSPALPAGERGSASPAAATEKAAAVLTFMRGGESEMVGIALSGGYIPVFRIECSAIAKAWERRAVGTERSVANNDEDALTMAVEASLNCLGAAPKESIDGLYFATTTSPYAEKMSAVMIAAAVDLGRELSTADFGCSLRAGTAALRAALDAVKSGSARSLLVAAADARLGYPRSDQEQLFGDGAAALLVASDNLLATYEGGYSIANEMYDVWRNPEDRFVRNWESRFIISEGYIRQMTEVVSGALKKLGLNVKDITRAVLPAPDPRTHRELCKKLGLDPEKQVSDPLLDRVGFCGAAHPLLMLAGALEAASPGDLLLLGAYAEGADALVFRVTDDIKRLKGQRTVQQYLEKKIPLGSYAKFLSYKGVLESVPGEPFRLFPSATVTWRDRDSILRCHGSKCNRCGTVTFPIQRVCYSCHTRDDYIEYPISRLQGRVFTFSRDNLAGRSDDPTVVQTVAELGEEKVRFYGMMTDCLPSDVQLGMPVELTFRRIYEGMGMHNYFWKCRPLALQGE
jgi:hydroxymethylglutaryl-CoA synthase